MNQSVIIYGIALARLYSHKTWRMPLPGKSWRWFISGWKIHIEGEGRGRKGLPWVFPITGVSGLLIAKLDRRRDKREKGSGHPLTVWLLTSIRFRSDWLLHHVYKCFTIFCGISKMLDTEGTLCSGIFSLAFLFWVVRANPREACSAIVRGGGSGFIASQCGVRNGLEWDDSEECFWREWRAERACGSQQSSSSWRSSCNASLKLFGTHQKCKVPGSTKTWIPICI